MSDWISVNDRLPDEGQNVLLVYSYFCKKSITIDRLYKNNFRSTLCKGFKAVCWMPLPEPPEVNDE